MWLCVLKGTLHEFLISWVEFMCPVTMIWWRGQEFLPTWPLLPVSCWIMATDESPELGCWKSLSGGRGRVVVGKLSSAHVHSGCPLTGRQGSASCRRIFICTKKQHLSLWPIKRRSLLLLLLLQFPRTRKVESASKKRFLPSAQFCWLFPRVFDVEKLITMQASQFPTYNEREEGGRRRNTH